MFFFSTLPQVTITASEPYTTTDNPYPVFVIDYGARLDVLDPLRLFELAPRDARHDVLYEPDRGRLFVGVSVPDPSLPADLTVTVAPGTAADGAGRPSSGATLTLQYRLGARTGAAAGALLANGAWGVAAAGAAGAAALTGALAPSTAPAGALGFALPGLAHWAQRAFFASRLAIPSLPRPVRDVGGALAWSAGGAPSPFDGAVAARATRGATPLGGGRLPPPLAPFAPSLLRVAADGHLLDASKLPANMSAGSAGSLPLPALPSVGTTARGVGPLPDPRPVGAPAPPPPPPPPPPPTAVRWGRGGKPPPEPPKPPPDEEEGAPAPAPTEPAPAPAAEAPTRRRGLLQLLRGGPFGGGDAVATGGASQTLGGGATTAATTTLDEAAAAGNHVGLLGRLAGITLPPITVRVQPTPGKAPSAAPTPAPAPGHPPPRAARGRPRPRRRPPSRPPPAPRPGTTGGAGLGLGVVSPLARLPLPPRRRSTRRPRRPPPFGPPRCCTPRPRPPGLSHPPLRLGLRTRPRWRRAGRRWWSRRSAATPPLLSSPAPPPWRPPPPCGQPAREPQTPGWSWRGRCGGRAWW